MRIWIGLALAATLCAENRPMTLKAVLELAMAQNPDIALARLDERKAADAVRLARDPFYPRLVAGSGLAYSNGFPMSIEGSSPSIVEVRAIASIFNRSQRLMLDKSKEDERGVKIATEGRREQVAYRAVSLYIEAGRLGEAEKATRGQIGSFEKMLEGAQERVKEGRELAIEEKRARLKLALARQRVERLAFDRDGAAGDLALLLGMGPDDKVVPVEAERAMPEVVETEGDAVTRALQNSTELRRLESSLKAKELEMKSYYAQRFPTVDLVAQYGLFAKFNNYDEYFRKFQRNNGQLGMSFRIPLFPSIGSRAQKDVTSTEMVGLRQQLASARARIASGARRAWAGVAQQQTAAEVAKLDLDVAREQVSIVLALFDEGRATLKQVEEARLGENEKWLGLFDARYGLDRARLDLLKETGNLLALLR